MKNKNKIILIICIIIGICSILVGSIAYYRIVVEGSIKGSTGNAVFVLKDENSNVWNNKEINLGKVNPGDSGEFTVTMDASGSTVDMYATLEIERTNLPTNLKFYTTSDHKSELHKYYSFLETTNQTETQTIYWYWNPYIDDIEDSKFINVSNLEAKIKVSAVQISEYAMMKNGNGVTSSDRMYFWKDNYRPYIRTITFGNDLSNLPSNCTEENLCFDVTGDGSKKKVYGYLIDSGLKVSIHPEQSLYNLYIVSEAPIFAPQDCSLFFAGFNSLVNINYNNNFNTSKVTNMSYMFMPATPGDWGDIVTLTANNKKVKPSFIDRKNDGVLEMMISGGDSSVSFYSVIEKLDLSNFNTSKVTNMINMFSYCESLMSLDLSNFNTSNVTDMGFMFNNCSSLTSLVFNNFNTSKVTNMQYMFLNCGSLMSLDLSSFNTSKVTSMFNMFYGCSSLTSLVLNNFNTSNVTSMDAMFSNCSSLISLVLNNFNTSNVTSMGSMFNNCSSLTNLDLSSFNTSNVTHMSFMFSDCSSLTSLDLSGFNTSNVTNMRCMFDSCSSLTNLDLNSFNTSKVTNMERMFDSCSSLTNLDLSSFNTSKVTDMSFMFNDCQKLQTQINIMNAGINTYSSMFRLALTDPDAHVIIGYTTDTQSIAEAMKATASTANQSKITLKQI